MRSDPPRAHHYVFAHRELPALAHDPRFFPLATGAGGSNFAIGYWDHVGARLPPAERLPPTDMALRVERRGGRTIVLVRLPAPERMTEAHLVAVVQGLPGEPDVRYFTLELGFASAEPEGPRSRRTVLCEWTEGRHVNYGEGPPAEEAGFLAAVEDRLGTRPH